MNQANRSQATGAYGTDYTKWDMWCPEDEEDDLFNSLTPNNPAFRTMERDIDERHKRWAGRHTSLVEGLEQPCTAHQLYTARHSKHPMSTELECHITLCPCLP
jgi:hypothetical protein